MTIDAAIAELNTAWTAASEELYKASQSSNDGNAGAQQPGGNGHQQQEGQGAADTVTDAEFEEVK